MPKQTKAIDRIDKTNFIRSRRGKPRRLRVFKILILIFNFFLLFINFYPSRRRYPVLIFFVFEMLILTFLRTVWVRRSFREIPRLCFALPVAILILSLMCN